MCLNSGSALGAIILALAMRRIFRRANQKLNNSDGAAAVEMQDGAHAEVAGLSDEERQSVKNSRAYVT